PYRERGVSVISLIVDGSNDEISALTGKLGRITGATVKSMITKSGQ
ncbi:MAG: CopG family transcriptional regulator, partial [Clostridiales bacterium]|nr:CopG family transcriptional regulator [Clostridiales bacterium]